MKYFYLLLLLTSYLYANETDMVILSKKLHLYAGSKATIQWERVFSSQRRLKEYKLDTLSKKDLKKLKEYLINHSADSDQPIVPGL